MDAVGALAARGGAARTATLRAAGVTRESLEDSVATGAVVRARRGVYCLPGADRDVLAAVNLHGSISCVSALARHGVALRRRYREPHVTVPHSFSRQGRDLRAMTLHHVNAVQPGQGLVPCEPVERALDVAGRCLSARDHLIAVDSALHQGLVRPNQIAAFTASSRERRGWLLAHMDGRAESPGETLARLDCAERGLAVHPQRFIAGVGRVDLVVEGRVVVEVDGRAFHSDPEQFKRDRRRDRRVTRSGMPVLRFAATELLGEGAVHVGDSVLEHLHE
ncbi:type IV toxin-antitoxin system AbiEi family antitoxin domain-containing protein [Demequina sp. NBRC 110056]|uniref:type IV toxin-antitoxin system AbiEi family antitoxin domain-containing protein n=1 Tax=Demequina sp. NBRC 110056 TaxID=1570345 RepID=UPI0009FC6071|nr:type IV toxin-antitoxin system AbiEi family antitoxin domain-containing protein [Demequina sp. NBRC 110056]